MRISKIDIPKRITELYGLESVQMKKLENVVLIAGKNGSGKSRLLKMISSTLNKTIVKESLYFEEKKTDLDNALNLDKLKKHEYLEEIKKLYTTYKDDVKDLNEYTKQEYFELTEFSKQEQLEFIKLSTNSTKLKDSKSISDYDAEKILNPKSLKVLDNYTDLTSIYLKSLIKKKLVESSKPKNSRNKEFISEYKNIESEIKNSLGTKLKFDDNLNLELFGLNPFSTEAYNTGLSEGQSILLQIIAAKENLKSLIDGRLILIDEPENYLYPENAIKYIKDIIALNPNGQTWILTHSIGILSALDPSLIWYMEEGEVSYAGNIPRRTLYGLLGGESNISRLENFIQLPVIMGANQFAYECLFDPKVVMTDSNDPQTNQVIESIRNNIKDQDKFTVLDFGCGKGRLFNSIYSNLKEDSMMDQIDYYGFDISNEHKDEFNRSLSQHYSDVEDRHIMEMDGLKELEENSFDSIVMVNVLHEIHPDNWITLFNASSPIYKLLKSTGYLLIVEDQHMHIGEKAHKHGFFLLDKLHLMKLFKFAKGNKNYIETEARNGRLKAHSLKKELVKRVTSESRQNSIKILRDTAKSQINKLRSDTTDFRTGKLIGLWLMQLANCDIYLDKYDL